MHDTHLLTLAQAAKTLPGHVHLSTIWRWARRGIKARGGPRVKLAHVRLGGKIYVDLTALEAFGRALADADAAHFDSEGATPAVPRTRTSTRRERDIQAAEAELDRAGVR